MYRAKDNGRNQLQFFTDELNSNNLYKMNLSNELHYAINKSELSISYQPQLDVHSGEVIGAEALLRWNNSNYGDISPEIFIPILEENGLIIPTTEWLIKETFRQWKIWENEGVVSSFSKLSINISPKHFANESLIHLLSTSIKEFNFQPENIVIEITESAMMLNKSLSCSVLKKLSAMGIIIALDDFGTGFSSLSYLTQFPIDYIKIDKSFMKRVNRKQEDKELVLAIINMARSLKLKVLAEGVDSEEKLDFLASNQCDMYQGFLFSKALSISDFEHRLTKYCKDGFQSLDNTFFEYQKKSKI